MPDGLSENISDIWEKLNDTRDKVIRVETKMEVIEGKVDCIDTKIGEIKDTLSNHNTQNAVNKIKIGAWGWFVRAVSIAAIGAVVTYAVKLILGG